jgi:hypothetical protein
MLLKHIDINNLFRVKEAKLIQKGVLRHARPKKGKEEHTLSIILW